MISIYKDFDNPPKDLMVDNPKITKAVKRELWELYNGKCAFTEEKIAFEEIEIARYRPVSLYPELKFEWSNLLPVSPRVNRLLSNKFRIQGKKINPFLLQNAENRKGDSAYLLAEEPLLLHPEVDTIENHLYFLDEVASNFSLKGKTTIELLELNYSELKIQRERLSKEVDSIINKLLASIKEQYNSEDYNNSNPNLFSEVNILSKHLKPIEKHLNKLLLLSKAKCEFSYFVWCYIERYVYGMNETSKFLKVSSSKKDADINQSSRYIIAMGSQYLLNAPSYIQKKDGNIYQLKLEDKMWESTLPYALQNIEIKKLYSIKNLNIESIPLNTRWIFLTGENGHGKTLILQSIVLTFSSGIKFDNDETNIVLKLKKKPNFLARLSFPRNINWHNFFEMPLINSKKTGDSPELITGSAEFTQYAAYGINRLELSGYIHTSISQAPQKLNKTDSLFANNNTLYNIEAYLISLHGREEYAHKLHIIKKVLLELLPSIKDIIIDDSQESKKVFYIETAEDGTTMPRIPFHALSTGSKSIIAMIGDMIIELMQNQDIEHPSELEGIVIIDEIDAHLHPKWQKIFVQTLTRLFPKIQFIASTHSPIPLLGAPKETIILNVEKPSKKEGITIRRLDIDVTTLTPNTILTSPIFGFDGIISSAHDYDTPLYTQDIYNDVIFEQHLNKKLDEFAEKSEIDLDNLLNNKADD